MKKEVRDFLNHKVVVLSQNASAEEAARAMANQHVGCVLTCSRRGINGIVTDRDLACYVLGDQLSPLTPLSVIALNEELYCVTEEDSIETVVDVMKTRGVRRVPVIREISGGRSTCVGIITLDDLIMERLINISTVREVIASQVRIFRQHQSMRAQRKKEARREQAENIFFKTVAREMEMPRDEAEPIIMFLLKSIIERIHPQEAEDLISSLPKNIQDDLLDVTAGPNKEINSYYIIKEMRIRFGLTQPASERRIRGFWIGLELYLLNNECNHILSQLPRDMQILLIGEPFQYKKLTKLRKASVPIENRNLM